jgi:3-methylfumaryl-CoA hydratase
VPLPRRMWAGGAVTFHGDLKVGDRVERTSKIVDVNIKHGRTGILCFVDVDHRITANGRLAVEERHNIVYRGAEGAVKAHPPAERGDKVKSITPDPVLLFRYSALTFNGHRIHYDHPYATKDEGYPDLVVHGPLQATLLLHFAAELAGTAPNRFSFRGQSPLFANTPFLLHAKRENGAMMLWTARENGPSAMAAQAQW